MLRKIEKNAKSKEEDLALASQEFGVPVSELSYKVEREVGKGLMGLLLGKEGSISAWITKEAEEEEEKLRKIAQKRAESEKLEAKDGSQNPYAPKEEPAFLDHVGPGGRQKKKPAEKAKTPQIAETKTLSTSREATVPAIPNTRKIHTHFVPQEYSAFTTTG